MHSSKREKSDSFQDRLLKLLEQLQREKDALNKILNSVENNKSSETIKKENK
jgi:hypothetical protein